ncbi:MAG: beta-lactamase family protein [Phycisphaerales bacterium]|nr:beta-lactamase family protein [Phycisphaerales bacterium]
MAILARKETPMHVYGLWAAMNLAVSHMSRGTLRWLQTGEELRMTTSTVRIGITALTLLCGVMMPSFTHATAFAESAEPAGAAEATPTIAPTPEAVRKALGVEARKRVVEAVEEAVKSTGYRGAALVGVDGEAVLMKGWGRRLPPPARGPGGDQIIDKDSVFEIASISKVITAQAILKLAEQKKLSLDDEIGVWLQPEMKPDAVPASWKGVTIRHLLSHSSGLDNDTGISPYNEQSRTAAVKKFARSAVLTKPGEAFAYNNAAYCMLAVIIERASGQEFERFIKSEIFDPAGMASSAFPPGTGLDVKQRVRRKATVTMNEHPWGWGYKGCGGVLTTMSDLLAWDKAARENRIISKASETLMRTGVVKNDTEEHDEDAMIGLAWFISSHAGREKLTHTGGSFGVRCVMFRYPNEGVIIVTATDDSAEPLAIAQAAEGALLEELSRAGIRGQGPLKPSVTKTPETRPTKNPEKEPAK